MKHMTKIFVALVIALNLVAIAVLAQTSKGNSSATPKTTAQTQKGAGSASKCADKSTEEQTQRRPGGADERELTPPQKRDATKFQIVSVNATAPTAKASLKVDLPKGIELKGFDAVFEVQFSNGRLISARIQTRST